MASLSFSLVDVCQLGVVWRVLLCPALMKSFEQLIHLSRQDANTYRTMFFNVGIKTKLETYFPIYVYIFFPLMWPLVPLYVK